MPFARSNGMQLYWTEQGKGPPVLLIMGLSFTHEMWFRVVPVLSQNHRVILFDNRGMGRSDVPPIPYTIPQLAEDAAVILDAAGVSRADVIGASMGGMVAQELALRYPARVDRLILGCTSYSGLFARWPDFRYLPRRSTAYGANGPDQERSIAPLLYADTTPRERIEEDFRVRAACAWCSRGFFGQLAGILLWNAYFRLPRIAAPTLVVHGKEDRLIPFQNGRTVANRIPNARFQLIPNAGHILMTDQPEICNRLLLDFLGS